MKRKLIKSVALSLLVCSLLATPALADTIGGATVTTTNTGLNLRAQASTSAGCLSVIPNGTFLLVEEKLDGWYKVCYNGVEGYVSSDFVSFNQSMEGTYAYSGATTGSNVNMRSAATTNSAAVKCIVTPGSSLNVIGVDGAWLKVQDATGAVGYIRSDFVQYKGASASQTKGDQIVATAMQYKGYAYRWGGMSPATGFDCSGFVNYVYKQYDYSMERTAQGIYNSSGTAVSKDQLQPGDILCFGWSAYSINHVGIYIGNGQFIHASTSTTGVIISDLDSNYYTQKYVGAKRMIE